jgi:uncharacterized protein YjbI with pentapeptide repeats
VSPLTVTLGFLAMVCASLLAGGLALWWPPDESPDRSSDLGAALLGGAAIALVAIAIERAIAHRSERVQARREELHERTRRSGLLRQRIATTPRTPTGRLPLVHLGAEGLDLSGAHLADSDLHSARLAGADLTFADLSGSHLGDADLRGAVLKDADLYRCNLLTQNLKGCDFSNAYLAYANVLWPAFVEASSIRDANLVGLTCQDTSSGARRQLTPGECRWVREEGGVFLDQPPTLGPRRERPPAAAVE